MEPDGTGPGTLTWAPQSLNPLLLSLQMSPLPARLPLAPNLLSLGWEVTL